MVRRGPCQTALHPAQSKRLRLTRGTDLDSTPTALLTNRVWVFGGFMGPLSTT